MNAMHNFAEAPILFVFHVVGAFALICFDWLYCYCYCLVSGFPLYNNICSDLNTLIHRKHAAY